MIEARWGECYPHLALAEDDGGNALGLSDLRRISSLSAYERPKSWVIFENAEAFRPDRRLFTSEESGAIEDFARNEGGRRRWPILHSALKYPPHVPAALTISPLGVTGK